MILLIFNSKAHRTKCARTHTHPHMRMLTDTFADKCTLTQNTKVCLGYDQPCIRTSFSTDWMRNAAIVILCAFRQNGLIMPWIFVAYAVCTTLADHPDNHHSTCKQRVLARSQGQDGGSVANDTLILRAWKFKSDKGWIHVIRVHDTTHLAVTKTRQGNRRSRTTPHKERMRGLVKHRDYPLARAS